MRQLIGALALLLVCASGMAAADQEAAPPKKVSKIIPTAGEVALPNGIGDVLPSGPCGPEKKAFCKDVDAGEGRLAACLTARIAAERKGNVAGRAVSDACVDAVADFKIERSNNVNADVPLARACKDDAAKICGGQSDKASPGSVVACLRGNTRKLAPACAKQVLRAQLEAADDYRLDARLRGACEASVKTLCADVEPGDGRELDCLADKSKQLKWDCLEQVVRFQKEASDDIRLSVRLFRRCLSDQKKFCADVEPGHMRVQECLEDNMDAPDFSAGCRKDLEDALAKRVADFRIDADLVEACADDLRDACSAHPASFKTKDNATRARAYRRAVACLQTLRDELASPACRDKVRRKMARAARDVRLDDVLAEACAEDRKALCNDVQPGSARVIRCLEDGRASLSQKCAAALFDHEVRMAEDIDFKYPMRRACGYEIATLCKDAPHGHARVVRCLQKQLNHEDMSRECKAEVERDARRAATDYRLNWRLNRACASDVDALCGGLCAGGGGGSGGGSGAGSSAGAQPCGGVVLQCLSERRDNITSAECQEEVAYYELMEVTDFRNDVLLAEACRGDVDKYCRDVEPGEGRVHACLRHQASFLSERCRAEESKLAAAAARDIRLRPRLARACAAERAAHCAGVPPGRARVLSCLLEHSSEPNFGAECRAELTARADALAADPSLAGGAGTAAAAALGACGDEAKELCAEEKGKLRAGAATLSCLVRRFDEAGEQCQADLGRTARLALWDYASGSPLTAACDADVASFCPKNTAGRPGGAFTIGAAGHCLSKALVERRPLSDACRRLVLAAAPRDARAYLSYPGSTPALVAKLADAQRAAGLEGVLLDPYARRARAGGAAGVAGAVTVTGWAALACVASIAIVSAGGAAALLRRLTGRVSAGARHTLYVKSGDA